MASLPAILNAALAQMLEATPMQRSERISETFVAQRDILFGKKPFRTGVAHVGVRSEIERYNNVLHDVTRNVLTNIGIEQMLNLNA